MQANDILPMPRATTGNGVAFFMPSRAGLNNNEGQKMTTENDEKETVSETLEAVFARSIDSIQGVIDAAPGLYPAAPERLAELVQLARTLEAKTERLADEIYRDQAETAADIEAEDAEASGNGAEGLPVAESWDDVPEDDPLETDRQKDLWRHGLIDIAPKTAEDARRLGVKVFSNILGQVAALSPKCVAHGLARYEWDPLRNLAIDDDTPGQDAYTVSHSWTIRGMRSFLTMLEFMNWIEFGLRKDGESEFTYPAEW